MLSCAFLFTIFLFGSSHVRAQNFSLYPILDPTNLSNLLNISIDCLAALNTTLPCDPTLLDMVQEVDNYWWEADNLTDLCTKSCFDAVEYWDQDVEARCYYDTLTAYNKIVPASSVSGRYSNGFHYACLTSGNATESDGWYSDDSPSWCLIDSQNWIGSDFIKPNCTTNPTNSFCSDPTNLDAESQRIANLYGNDVLCSECFIQTMYQKLISPYLPDHDFSDYLIGEYQDILDVCNYSNAMPELIIRALPDYSTAIPPTLNLSAVGNDTICTGQMIVASTLSANANCNSISQAFNAATGDVQAATGNANCTTSKNSFCLQQACTLLQVPNGATCDALAASVSTANLTVTTLQLLTWNPHINGLCDALIAGDYVCASAPGGSYIPPTPPATAANDGGQARGGGDGGELPLTSTTTPKPMQSGVLSLSGGCKLFAQAPKGDYCYNFAQEFSISTAQLYSWNSVLGVGGANCSTNFWAGNWYCVSGPPISSTSSSKVSSITTSLKPSSTASAAPSPTQTGISPKCNKWAQAGDGDYCYIFAQNNGITTDQLYAWNTVLGASGANCSTLFWKGEYYCIGVGS